MTRRGRRAAHGASAEARSVAPRLDRSLLRRLAEWDGGSAPITSVSLSVDGRRYPRMADVELRLDELLRRARTQAEDVGGLAPGSVERDLEAMSRFVREEFERGDARGLAMFSAHDAGLWEAVRVPRPLVHRAVVGPAADLLPLEMLLETYRPSCLALVDYEKARLFVLDVGGIEEVRDVADEVPGRHDQGGWSQMRMQRHVDDHRARHVRHVAESLFRLWRRRRFEQLILAGPAEAHRDLEGDLHDYLRRRVCAHVALPITASTRQVLEKVMEVEEASEREAERGALDRLSGAIGAENGGVAGTDAVLEALSAGRVGELLVAVGAEAPGTRCPACGRLTTGDDRCPACGSSTEAVPDVIEAAVAMAFRSGARVEMIGDEEPMRRFGGAGALLRY